MLLNSSSNLTIDTGSENSWQDLPAHGDEEQVQRDVDRAFVYYPNSMLICLHHSYH